MSPKECLPTATKSVVFFPQKKRGNLKPAEIKPLVMAARKAYEIQLATGNVDACETFDSWRHMECLAAVSKPGITACSHEDYQPLLSHFRTLAGDDGAAFASAMAGGKATDHAAAGDTREARRHKAHLIASALATHAHLAGSTVDALIAEDAQEFYRANPLESYPGPAPEWLASITQRKAAIEAKGKGPISVGYLIWLVRGKTQRPELNLGKDWQAGLAERCTASQLAQILFTITNRISALEGLGTSKARNKSQRSPKAKADRDAGELSDRW